VPSFGDEIPTAAVDDPAFFVCKGEVGLVCIDTVWTLCQLVKNDVLGEWRRKKLCGQKHDFRLAGDYVLCGNRQATFAESLERSPQEKDIAGWPMGGERAALEFTASLNTAGYTWLTHHLDFVAKSGISKGSGSCRTHRRISEALSLFAQFDFLNVVNLAGAEFLIQYLIQLETAIQRNPKAPDFTFLDEFLASGVNESGAVMVPKYAHVVAERQRDKANTMKQQRLWAEEQNSRRRKGDDPKGRGRGKKGKAAEDAADDDA